MYRMNRLTKYALLAAVAVSLASAVAVSLGAGKALAGCKTGHVDAGIGNGSFFGDPGNSGAHNQAANAPAQPQSAAADDLHELDDTDEPN